MAYDEPVFGRLPKPRKPKAPKRPMLNLPDFDVPDVGPVTLPPVLQTLPPAVPDWSGLLQQDPGYLQELSDITSGSQVDRQGTLAAFRTALARFGGDLRGTLSGLASPGWEDLVDEATLGTAAAADTSGTSLSSQIAKAHAQRLLAEEDVRAAKGILSSGQSGYEIGEARQANTIARTNAVNSLLDFLRGGIGGYGEREYGRTRERTAALERAANRVRDLGLTPPPPANPLSIIDALRNATSRKAKRRSGLVE